MKTLWKSIKVTGVLFVLLSAGYVFILWTVAKFAAPNGGQAETIIANGKTAGAVNIGQKFTKPVYFWGRPSAVDYSGAASGGSNKGTADPGYLAEIAVRIDNFMKAHPYLERKEVPSEMVTASGSGLDPHISPAGARVQIERVAQARGVSPTQIREIADSLTEKPWLGLFGTSKINVLKLNVALDEIFPAPDKNRNIVQDHPAVAGHSQVTN